VGLRQGAFQGEVVFGRPLGSVECFDLGGELELGSTGDNHPRTP
jgi:hypothetical protein